MFISNTLQINIQVIKLGLTTNQGFDLMWWVPFWGLENVYYKSTFLGNVLNPKIVQSVTIVMPMLLILTTCYHWLCTLVVLNLSVSMCLLDRLAFIYRTFHLSPLLHWFLVLIHYHVCNFLLWLASKKRNSFLDMQEHHVSHCAFSLLNAQHVMHLYLLPIINLLRDRIKVALALCVMVYNDFILDRK